MFFVLIALFNFIIFAMWASWHYEIPLRALCLILNVLAPLVSGKYINVGFRLMYGEFGYVHIQYDGCWAIKRIKHCNDQLTGEPIKGLTRDEVYYVDRLTVSDFNHYTYYLTYTR